MVKVSAHLIACSVIAITRKHLNCEIVWPHELTVLTQCSFNDIKDTYLMIEQKYTGRFPSHAASQQSIVGDRQHMQ